ncbi:MAG: hypothetical protein K9M07_01780 [Simkaniaceae bacterium]|nr:hypothetical protein [Simkaniaceae bacterium]MCF7851952.1 hypothetical protein [Simkaniaceae bacterium]
MVNVAPSSPFVADVSMSGDPSAQIASITKSEIAQLLSENGMSEKSNPFMLFYFYLTMVLGGDRMKEGAANIDKFSAQLKEMSSYLNLANAIKSEFYGCADADHSVDVRNAVKTFLNTMLGTFFENVKAFPPFKGGKEGQMDNTYFSIVLQYIQKQQTDGNTQFFEKNFPTLGQNVINLMTNLQSLGSCVFVLEGNQPENIHSLWQKAQSSGGYGLPNAYILQPYIDCLSEESTTVGGIASAESSKLQYAVGVYNKLEACVHDLMNQWLVQRKRFDTSMKGARN